MSELQIKILYHTEEAGPVKAAHTGEWYDLRAAYDCHISKGEFYTLPLGVSIALPEGYEAILAPRSSLFGRHGLIQTNSIGVIDHAYSGENDEWRLPVYATMDTTVAAGERIAQFRIQLQQPAAELVTVTSLSEESRGGFGSTGVE